MLLFPTNIGQEKKVENVTTVWDWSGTLLSPDHPLLRCMRVGIGSTGQAYNSGRWREMVFFVRLMQDWKVLSPAEQQRRVSDPWAFASWIDGVEGASHRQLRHILVHLLFPDEFERISSPDHKERVEAAFRTRLDGLELTSDESANSPVGQDRRLLRIRRALEQDSPGEAVDYYVGALREQWLPSAPPRSTSVVREGGGDYNRPLDQLTDDRSSDVVPTGPFNLFTVLEALRTEGLRISERMLRRYYLALEARGFVILSGVSGTGKTWLAQAFAEATGARVLVVPVAPNWTTNEDLLGFADPISGAYRDTPFSRFLRLAAADYATSRRDGRPPQRYHLILDEMNLARVEYYFATFLSAMEMRMRDGEARIELGPDDSVHLPPTLKFIGTVNVDETTHGFADKVYDRAQIIELGVDRDALQTHLGEVPYAAKLLEVWDIVHAVAPFAFRVLDDAARYTQTAEAFGLEWEELLDEVILQKILPKVRGTDPRVGDVLHELQGALTREHFPLSHAKLSGMLDEFQQHGVASYF